MDPFDAEILARTVWMEARGEPYEGKLAVAYVILNRHSASNRKIARVCLDDLQFSCWNAAKDDSNRERMADLGYNDPGLVECRKAVEVASLGGSSKDPTRGATSYHANWMQTFPGWALKMQKTAEIGRHIFYREK